MEGESKIKVIHVCPYAYSKSGGHSNAIRALAEGQLAYGADVTVLSYQEKESCQAASTVKIESYQNNDELVNYFKKLAGNDLLVVSFCGVRSIDLSSASVCRKRGIKYVFSSGGALHYRTTTIWFKKLIYVNFLTRYFRGASGLVVTTEFERDRLSKLLPGYTGQLGVIPNIIEQPATIFSHETATGNDFTFGFMGRLDILHKGLDLLIPAFAGLPHEVNSKLVLVGPDHDGGKDMLEKLIRKYDLEDRVEIRAPAYGEDKEIFFTEIDCFVSLSRWEAFGISFVEAMSRGVASILSDQVNLKMEILKHQAAELVSLNISDITESMLRMVKDKPYRLVIGKSGEKWASNAFKQNWVAEDSLKFYATL